MKPIITVFYSWQSDLPKETNRNAIRQSLREASNQIESELVDIRVEIDEATRETTGSPNIPQTIFNKIFSADIFICDLTTINANAPEEFRRVPNPNVLIELGYAIAELGWERIIMLFNTFYGSFPKDLPFDIDRHRATPFAVKDKKDHVGKAQLSKVLKFAVQEIIIKAPLKPAERRALTPEQKKRNVTISNLRWALSAVHIPIFDSFLEELPYKIVRKIFFFQESFRAIIGSNSFHLYDDKLAQLLFKFNENWTKSLSYWQHYSPDMSGDNYRFHIPMDIFPSDEARNDFYAIEKLQGELAQNFKELLHFVRDNYLEIDLDETSKSAFESYKKDLESD